MLDFLFSPVVNLFVGLLSGVVCTTLIAEIYFKDKIYKEKAKRFATEEKLQLLHKHLQDVEAKLYISSREKVEKEYVDRFTVYGKEINRKPMVFETVEQDGKIVACTGRLN